MERNVDANGDFVNASIITAVAFTNNIPALTNSIIQIEAGTSEDNDVLNMKVYINRDRITSAQLQQLAQGKRKQR